MLYFESDWRLGQNFSRSFVSHRLEAKNRDIQYQEHHQTALDAPHSACNNQSFRSLSLAFSEARSVRVHWQQNMQSWSAKFPIHCSFALHVSCPYSDLRV